MFNSLYSQISLSVYLLALPSVSVFGDIVALPIEDKDRGNISVNASVSVVPPFGLFETKQGEVIMRTSTVTTRGKGKTPTPTTDTSTDTGTTYPVTTDGTTTTAGGTTTPPETTSGGTSSTSGSSTDGPAMTATITVSNAAELMSALQNAKGGEKIALNPGDYGNLNLWSGAGIPATYSSQVTIVSADPGNPAVITGIKATGVGNLEFDSVIMKYNAPPGVANHAQPFGFTGCSDITISNSKLIGDLAEGLNAIDDGYGTGRGLVFLNSSNITVENNTLVNFHRGAIFGSVDGLVVSGNDVSGMSSDGFNFAAVSDVVIQGNHLHDFRYSPETGAHPDMIQFWTAGTTIPSVNIVIKDNFLDQGAGDGTQSIFMRNDMVDTGKAGVEMYYQNVSITNNVIVNSSSHGISLGEANGVLIDNNTILQRVSTAEGGGTVSVPKINVSQAAVNVTITDNVIPSNVNGVVANAGWTVTNNIMVDGDNASSSNYIGALFTDALDRTNSSLADYQVMSGTQLANAGLGSTLTHSFFTGSVNGYFGVISTETSSDGGFMVQKFDASSIFNKTALVDVSGAKAVWNFGDGTTGEGLVADHVYAKAGNYEASVVITLANGEQVKVDKTVMVSDVNLLHVDFESSANDLSSAVNAVTLNSATFETSDDGRAIRLNGGTVKYDAGHDFFANDQYSLLVDFKKDSATMSTGGRLVYFGGVFIVTVGADSLEATVTTTGGSKTIKVSGIGILDADWHKVALTFDGDAGIATLYLDGNSIGSVGGLSGTVQTGFTSSDLIIGGPFGGSFVGLVDNLHYVADSLSADQIASGDPLDAWARDSMQSSSAISNYANDSGALLPYGLIGSNIETDALPSVQ